MVKWISLTMIIAVSFAGVVVTGCDDGDTDVTPAPTAGQALTGPATPAGDCPCAKSADGQCSCGNHGPGGCPYANAAGGGSGCGKHGPGGCPYADDADGGCGCGRHGEGGCPHASGGCPHAAEGCPHAANANP